MQYIKKRKHKKQKKEDELQSGKQCSGMLWREKYVFNDNTDISKF